MNKKDIAIEIIRKLHQKGHEAYLAGGCVRDELRGETPKDYDIATSALPDQVQKLFPKTVPVGAQFGVILVIIGDIPFEVATFRSDHGYQDGRHPSKVTFTNVVEDAKRRDFTVNGLYYDIKKQTFLDFVQGHKDIEKKLIRTIGKPEDRFQEDHLRMLRAVRFAVQLGFEIDPKTFEAIPKMASKITSVSQERIREELSKILISEQPERGLKLMEDAGLLTQILPEVEKMKGVEQPLAFHPEGDVYVHTMIMMERLSETSDTPIELAMAALLHDIAKPATFVRATDRIRFSGHDLLGAEMAETICKRLTFSNDQTELICSLIHHHLRFKDAKKMRLSTLKRFCSLDRFDLHLELHRLDCLASHGDLEAYEFCKSKYEEFANEPPPPLKLINGHDLIGMGLVPSPEFSKILRTVEDQILEGTVQSREEALEYVKDNFLQKKDHD